MQRHVDGDSGRDQLFGDRVDGVDLERDEAAAGGALPVTHRLRRVIGLEETEPHRAVRSRGQDDVPADVDVDVEAEVVDVEVAARRRVVDDEQYEVLAHLHHDPQPERSGDGRVKRAPGAPATWFAGAGGAQLVGAVSTAPPPTDHRAALAEFLRARREALTPAQVGLPAGRARRTPGLRREEVAMLAGVSVTWYTWLEQGRRINASADVLRAIGRALRLDTAGIDHLAALGQPAPPAPRRRADATAPTTCPSALRRLIDAFEPAPAYVLGPRWEFAAWNPAQARLYPRIESLPDDDRTLLWVLFCDPSTRRTDRRLGPPRPPGARRVPRLDDGACATTR